MPKKRIVDDSLSQGRTIIAIARDLGYDSEMTEKGSIGLGNITARTPDCVTLANRLMPERKGMQILENLSESKIRGPVVERTADTQYWMTGQSLDLSANVFLNKRIQQDKLAETHRSVLHANEVSCH